MIKAIVFSAAALMAAGASADENGILKQTSKHSVQETVERFEAAVRAKGIKVFPRFDHAAAAEEYGLELPSLVVVSFGNPKYGTKFMARAPLAGIDFPPKALVYEDDEGKVWLAYNSSKYLYEVIFKRHGLDYSADDVEFYAKLLEELTDQAVK
ncbi:MAG: DUF302 domain-containing protein [Verrucomicrobiota bacterium]